MRRCVLCRKREFAVSPKKKLSRGQGSCLFERMEQCYGSETQRQERITSILDEILEGSSGPEDTRRVE